MAAPACRATICATPTASSTEHGYRVVAFDQLGCGASDQPEDPAFWSITRYVEETETVRRALGLGKVHLLGHSWGGWLAIEYALTYPEALKTLILEDTAADLPHLMQEMHRLRSALGTETVEMLLAHEADGSYHHPEYQAAITLMNYRHVCRLSIWPKPLDGLAERLERRALYGNAGAERVPLYRQPQGLEPHPPICRASPARC